MLDRLLLESELVSKIEIQEKCSNSQKSAVSVYISRWVVVQEEQSCGRFKGFH